MMDRAANCVAAAEDGYRRGSSPQWAERFSTLLRNLEFLPNSPTLMNAGTDLGLLAGCFVLPVEDSLRSIFTTLGQAAEIQRAGGGTGYTFSHLRPAGDRVASTGGTASGPMSFLRLYDTAAGVVSMGGRRRGACMAVLDASHPDIYDFITTKAESPSDLTHFNLSVGVTDAFLRAAQRDGTHRLVNSSTGKTVARVSAVELFDAICDAAHACGDPGLVFLDTINRANPLPGRGRIEAINPCGEVPLLPYESCNLGSINLARMTSAGHVDWDRLADVAELAVRFLDDVIDVSRYPFSELGQATRAGRKIGLGVMGLAEMLADLGIPYDSDRGVRLAGQVMRCVQQAAHAASARLADDRGSFPASADSRFAGSTAMRNAQVTSVAPTGTISLIAGTTAGIEPMFAIAFTRAIVGRHLLEVNPCFDRLARDQGFYRDELIAEIAQRGGVRGYAATARRGAGGIPDRSRDRAGVAPADADGGAAACRRRRIQDDQPVRHRDRRRRPRDLHRRVEGKGQGHHGVSLRQPRGQVLTFAAPEPAIRTPAPTLPAAALAASASSDSNRRNARFAGLLELSLQMVNFGARGDFWPSRRV